MKLNDYPDPKDMKHLNGFHQIPDDYAVSDRTKLLMINKPHKWCVEQGGFDYQSPITMIAGEIQTKIENDTLSMVQNYGFNVDKDELAKALEYDRNQYEKGYADGSRNMPKWIPTSERLPDEMEDVLLTIQIPDRHPVVRSGFYSDGLFLIDNGDTWKCTDPEVKAWMPQPTPYGQEDDDDE